MDKASDFGSEDCEFESRRGRNHFIALIFFIIIIFIPECHLPDYLLMLITMRFPKSSSHILQGETQSVDLRI